MSADFDVCIIGSGAGGGPVAFALAQAGRSVVVLEKGPWLREGDFSKDEIGDCRRNRFVTDRRVEPHAVEIPEDGAWRTYPTPETGWDFWNGNMVGGASNLMSGFFHRLKPDDFRLKSAFGPVEGAEVEDWPITYDELEPYYDLVERVVGVSGRVVPHPHADRRSSPDLPFPPLVEHPLSSWIDRLGAEMGLHPFPVPRAILSAPAHGRGSCSYSRYCGSYGCATGAKGSSRAALIQRAVATGRCEVRAQCMARRIHTDAQGRITHVEYHEEHGKVGAVSARVYVVACQSIETARLLLLSTGPKHPRGLANSSGQVGRNLLFSTAAWGRASLPYRKFKPDEVEALQNQAPFINRAFQDWYSFTDETGTRMKGGTLELLFAHPNPISQAITAAYSGDDGVLWGWPLKKKLEEHFKGARHLLFEVFADWMPHPDCHVTLDPDVKDRFGLPVARVRVGKHPRNKVVGTFLAERGIEILRKLGGEELVMSSRGAPATNLLAGACRFGTDPEKSALDRDCRAHDVENLFVTDGSFMPTGGSVPFTFTIYANAFRVAEKIRAQLGG
ncbi:MAG: GMC family oxidoreductase [Myxococcota bacterium]